MNVIPLLAEVPTLTIVVGVGAILFVFFIFVIIWASRYTKVGPNQVLVVCLCGRCWKRWTFFLSNC
jgi:uncharacterized membrane protein YqiK